MKALLLQIFRLAFRNPGFFLRFKDSVMINPCEHLFRTREFIRKNGLTRKGTTIIDVGAAEGDTALWFARNFSGHRIVAFEPVIAAYTRATNKTRNHRAITIHNFALSDTSVDAIMNITNDTLASSLKKPVIPDDAPAAHAHKLKVVTTAATQTKRLDDTGEYNDVLLIKIDTQGSELHVLRGAEKTMRKTHLILIEMNNHPMYENAAKYHELDAFLRDHGFELVDIYVTYRPKGKMEEYDALYRNTAL